jgi:DNA-binding MarR family transcriptional regulator
MHQLRRPYDPGMAEDGALEPAEWDLWHSWTRAQNLLVRELDRGLQRDCGISKTEFSVLMTLQRAGGRQLRVGELAEALDWEKSRVAHQLTRMENRGLVERTGAGGRRTGIGLTAEGRRVVEDAVRVHSGNIRRLFLDPLTAEQAAAAQAWSEQLVQRIEPTCDGVA